MSPNHVRIAGAFISAALIGTSLVACSSSGGSGTTEITYLTSNDEQVVQTAEKLATAFTEENPDITVTVESQPAGTEGDNLIKTKLSTGEMSDVFFYNTGSLLQALNPDTTLVDLSGEAWTDDVTDDFTTVVSTDKGMYGAPLGTSFGGGILYSRPVYERLGLTVPTTWDEFMSNSETIKNEAPDVAPILQSFGDSWTSQVFVLADFANIAQADPGWADDYTANKAKYADEPALDGFKHQQEAFDAGLFNQDYASMTLTKALSSLAEGTGAQFPMLTNQAGAIAQSNPDQLNDVGFFALPADDAANTAATIWQPNGLYIPVSTTGDKLDAAKKFVGFVASSDKSCEIQKASGVPSGPYVTSTCTLDSDVPQMVKDVQTYFDSGKTSPALEFLSPVKGPNLENIAVEVGSGISSAEDGAAAYDKDVEKQAQQLGLEGW